MNQRHYDLLIVIPASAERDQQRMDAATRPRRWSLDLRFPVEVWCTRSIRFLTAEVRETWTLDIDPETHQCARQAGQADVGCRSNSALEVPEQPHGEVPVLAG